MQAAKATLVVRAFPSGYRTRVLTVHGEIDIATSSCLRRELLAAVGLSEGGRVLVDLTPVTFFAAAGVQILTAGRCRAELGGTVVQTAVAPGTMAARVLELAGWVHDPGGSSLDDADLESGRTVSVRSGLSGWTAHRSVWATVDGSGSHGRTEPLDERYRVDS